MSLRIPKQLQKLFKPITVCPIEICSDVIVDYSGVIQNIDEIPLIVVRHTCYVQMGRLLIK